MAGSPVHEMALQVLREIDEFVHTHDHILDSPEYQSFIEFKRATKFDIKIDPSSGIKFTADDLARFRTDAEKLQAQVVTRKLGFLSVGMRFRFLNSSNVWEVAEKDIWTQTCTVLLAKKRVPDAAPKLTNIRFGTLVQYYPVYKKTRRVSDKS